MELIDLGSGQPLADFPMQAGAETAFVSAEIYRRDGAWKFRAVGQGYAAGLAGLAGDFGIDVGSSTPADAGQVAAAAPAAESPRAAPPRRRSHRRRPARPRHRPRPRRRSRPPAVPSAELDLSAEGDPGPAPARSQLRRRPSHPSGSHPARGLPPAPPGFAPPAPAGYAPTDATRHPRRPRRPAPPADPAATSAPRGRPAAPAPLAPPRNRSRRRTTRRRSRLRRATAAPGRPEPPPPAAQPPHPPTAPAIGGSAWSRTSAIDLRHSDSGTAEPRRLQPGLDAGRGARRTSTSTHRSSRSTPAPRSSSVVWYLHKNEYYGALQHTGDNRQGGVDGDAEQILIDLVRLPANVTSLVFTINSFRKQTFTDVANAYCAVLDLDSGEPLVRFDLSDSQPSTAVIMAELRRSEQPGVWRIRAIGEFHDFRTVKKLIPAAARQVKLADRTRRSHAARWRHDDADEGRQPRSPPARSGPTDVDRRRRRARRRRVGAAARRRRAGVVRRRLRLLQPGRGTRAARCGTSASRGTADTVEVDLAAVAERRRPRRARGVGRRRHVRSGARAAAGRLRRRHRSGAGRVRDRRRRRDRDAHRRALPPRRPVEVPGRRAGLRQRPRRARDRLRDLGGRSTPSACRRSLPRPRRTRRHRRRRRRPSSRRRRRRASSRRRSRARCRLDRAARAARSGAAPQPRSTPAGSASSKAPGSAW